jgi:hypothetical protein
LTSIDPDRIAEVVNAAYDRHTQAAITQIAHSLGLGLFNT